MAGEQADDKLCRISVICHLIYSIFLLPCLLQVRRALCTWHPLCPSPVAPVEPGYQGDEKWLIRWNYLVYGALFVMDRVFVKECLYEGFETSCT